LPEERRIAARTLKSHAPCRNNNSAGAARAGAPTSIKASASSARMPRLLLRRHMMNLGRAGRAHALTGQQKRPPFGDKVIDIVDGEREHGRSLLIEFAARGALGEPLDRAVDAHAYSIESGKRLRADPERS
jgi:hypothetical protein